MSLGVLNEDTHLTPKSLTPVEVKHLPFWPCFIFSFNICCCFYLYWLQMQKTRLSAKPSASKPPQWSTDVAIDQAPVSAARICAQTSVAFLKLTDTDDYRYASEGWWRKKGWMSIDCVALSVFRWAVVLFLTCFKLTKPFCAVQWFNEINPGALDTFSIVIVWNTLFLLDSTSMKWKRSSGSSWLARHRVTVLNQRGDWKEKHLLILFAAKGMGSLLCLPLIVILSRPAQDTGDFSPRIFFQMDKHEKGSNCFQAFFFFFFKCWCVLDNKDRQIEVFLYLCLLLLWGIVF